MQELTFNRELQIGDSGDDVLKLQRRLIGWGSKEQPVILDGEFGLATKGAVRCFQRAHTLEPDGVASEEALNSINRETVNHPFNLEDYTINISIQKDISKYDKVIPQHVRAAIEHQKATGKKYQKGETISFIKSNDKVGAKVLELAKFQDLDASKYRDLLQSALEQVLDALNIEFEEIIYKGYQKRPKKETETKKLDVFF